MTTARRTPANEETALQLRVLRLLSALASAGVETVRIEDFHAFAFFAEVLAPVWGVETPVGAVLKEEGGPHYPALQHQLDRLVGMGLVRVARLTADAREGRWKLDAAFGLRTRNAGKVLAFVADMPDEDLATTTFLEQLAFAFAEIPVDHRDDAAQRDAAWSAPDTSNDRLIRFSGTDGRGQKRRNYSAEAARYFQRYAPDGVELSAAEQTTLYMGLMRRRAGG